MGERAAAWSRRLQAWARSLDFTLARRFGLATREDRVFYGLIGLVGVVGGVLGMATEALIHLVQVVLWGSGEDLLKVAAEVPAWRVVAAPAVGGLLVGLITWRWRRQKTGAASAEEGGEGMAMLIEAVALQRGRIPPKPVLVNALAAVATVGSGGSLGREGPMIRLGAMIASWAGDRLGLPAHRLKILVGCGAAAGLAATYNIPIGGALFAMEVVLGNFALEIFGPIVASSVIATLIARAFTGNEPLYAAPGYALVSGWEMVPYIGLGIVGAFASVVFIAGVQGGGKAFSRLGIVPRPLRPVLGMALLGVLGLYIPHALGRGYGVINMTLAEQLRLPDRFGLPHELTILLLLGLAGAKLLATALTRGCGGAGGLFTPSLAFGALVGGAYGYWIHSLWPHIASPYGAYAAVGMAAVMAGTGHAPISSILILFEFTGNYDLILPLMVASIISSLLARKLRRYSIYTEALRRRGIELPWRMEEAVLAGLTAGDLVRGDPEVLRPQDGYRQVVDRFLATRRQRLFVVGEDRKLQGAISLHDIKGVLEHPESLTAVVAHDLMLPVDRAIRQEERLHRVTESFAKSDFERLPVVDAEDRFLGVLAKRDVLAVYAQEVLGRPALLATYVSSNDTQTSRQYVEIPPDFSLRMVPVLPELVGKTLAEARLPQTLGVRIIDVDRPGGEAILPGAETVLLAGDILTLLGPTAVLEELMAGRLPGPETVQAGAAVE